MIPVDLNGHGKIGLVQPYYAPGTTGETLLEFAVYQPIASMPTPAPPTTNYVPVTITSTPPGAPVTVTGTGCVPGTYPTPANLLWAANSGCTLTFPGTSFYVRDPESGATFDDNQRYAFAYATVGGGGPESANPQTVTVGTTPLTIDAVFNPSPPAPPAQNSVLEFAAGQQVAVAAQPVSVGPDFTLEAWVLASQSPNGFIIGKIANGDTFANYAIIGTVGMLAFQQSTSVPATFPIITVSTPSPVPLNTWTHVAAVLNSGIMQLYVDGELVATGSSPGPPAGQSVPFSLGAGTADGQSVCCGFSGSIRQARVWSRALSAAEIQTYATTVLTGTENGLVADWPLDDGTGLTARNLVPGGPPLTLMNGPSWITPAGSSGVPIVSAVSNAAGGQPGVVSGSFISIYGQLFASLPLFTWDNSISNGQLPSQLDGVQVTIGGQPAYISAITPGQINVQAPVAGNGSVQVVVTTPAGASAPFTAEMQQYAPAFFPWPDNQPVATHSDYTLAAANGTIPGTATVPAKPGEIITLWGTGFGPTNPAVAAGQLPGQNAGAATLSPVTVMVNGAPVSVLGAALSGYPGLYQVAIQLPASLTNGTYPLVAMIGGASSPTMSLSVQQ